MTLADWIYFTGITIFMGYQVIEVIKIRHAEFKAKERAIYQKYYEELSPEARAEDELWSKH